MGDNNNNNNNINTRKIFTSFFKLDKNNKEGDGRLNQRYFKEINRNNNWIDNNPYLPPFWGFIFYSIIYFITICSALFYVGVMKHKTDDDIQLDKYSGGATDDNDDTPYYLKAPFYSNTNEQTIYDIGIKHIFTGYKEPEKCSPLYSSIFNIFDIFNNECHSNDRTKMIYAFNTMYIENKLNDLTNNLNEAIQNNDYFNILICFVKWLIVILEVIINIFKDPIGLFLLILTFISYITIRITIYTSSFGGVIREKDRNLYRYINKTVPARNKQTNNDIIVKDIYINTLESFDYMSTNAKNSSVVSLNKYFEERKYSALINTTPINNNGKTYVLAIESNPITLTKNVDNNNREISIFGVSELKSLDNINKDALYNNSTNSNNDTYYYGLLTNNTTADLSGTDLSGLNVYPYLYLPGPSNNILFCAGAFLY